MNPRTNDSTRDQRERLAAEFLRLLHEKDIDRWAKLWADDGRIVVYYPPEGFSSLIEGKAQILTGFRALFDNFASFDAELAGVYPAVNADVITVRYNVHAMLANGEAYDASNIAVLELRNGLISVYHDYFDPRRFQKVVDALPSNNGR